MSQTKEQSEDQKNRVQVTNLPQEQKELKDREAQKITGGGGVSGGVNRGERHIGEEIPQ